MPHSLFLRPPFSKREGKPHCPCIQAHKSEVHFFPFLVRPRHASPPFLTSSTGFAISINYIRNAINICLYTTVYLLDYLLEKYLVNLEEEDEEKRKGGGRRRRRNWLTNNHSEPRERVRTAAITKDLFKNWPPPSPRPSPFLCSRVRPRRRRRGFECTSRKVGKGRGEAKKRHLQRFSSSNSQ